MSDLRVGGRVEMPANGFRATLIPPDDGFGARAGPGFAPLGLEVALR